VPPSLFPEDQFAVRAKTIRCSGAANSLLGRTGNLRATHWNRSAIRIGHGPNDRKSTHFADVFAIIQNSQQNQRLSL
jgi:hypothetical protein